MDPSTLAQATTIDPTSSITPLGNLRLNKLSSFANTDGGAKVHNLISSIASNGEFTCAKQMH